MIEMIVFNSRKNREKINRNLKMMEYNNQNNETITTEMPKYIASAERMSEAFNSNVVLENNEEELSHFSQEQKQIINDIIKDCYQNLDNLSK